jgi:hypothetical protein
MAIYSLNMRSVGRSTHAARAAGAHIRYITRPGAQPEIQAARMPAERNAARRWLDRQERADRKNARVIDKIMIALPRELHPLQRRKLVRDYAELVTRGRASWFAAIHATGKDAANPHAHLVIRDRDPDTGRRVVLLSERGACARVRQQWEEMCNAALERAARAERIDRRSYLDQGITDRLPSRHRGPDIPQRKRKPAPPPEEAAPLSAREQKRRKARRHEYRRNWRNRYKVRRKRKKPAPVMPPPRIEAPAQIPPPQGATRPQSVSNDNRGPQTTPEASRRL